MAGYRRRSSRGKRARRPFREKGLTTMALGAGLFVMSLFLSGAGPLGGAAKALHMPALVALGIGAVFVAIDVLMNKAADQPPLPQVDPEFNPTRNRVAALRDGDALPPRHAPWRAADAFSTKADGTPPKQWSAAVFDAIEWRRFEAVCETLFAQAGFETRTQSHGADGGVDIWLHSKNASGPALVVQCKHWRGKQVGVKEMREFFGVMASQGVKRGTYATSSTFTADATSFAKSNGIHLLDGAGLLGLIKQRTPEQQQALLAVAFEGDYARPTCASCGVKMVERQPKNGGSLFWGCKNYPLCRSTLPMRA
ncbi:MAG: restriction endonuclease [Hydrogenophaga sp.]|nr:restriction endonuclease [Hydrogenophaga sp.]